jgi:hypothetical protein
MALSTIPFSGLGADASKQGVNFRNLIINGDMSIAQRGTSSSGITGDGYYTLDRYEFAITSLGTWTFTQSTDVPSGQGFGYSQKADCTTADASPSAGDRIFYRQKFEGQNLQHLKKGTSSAESLTLSFWVKSNKTGTYIVELFDHDNTRHISKSYTVSSASTWEKKTINIDGDTTGAFTNDNNLSLHVAWWLGAGSTYTSGTLQTTWGTQSNADRAVGQVNLADNTANEWYITGVQLEVGTSASDFEFLPYDVNLQRCQRYFEKTYSIDVAPGTNTPTGQRRFNGSTDGSSNMVYQEAFAVTKRAAPTQTFYTIEGTSGSWKVLASGLTTTKSNNNWDINEMRVSAYFTFGSAKNFTSGYVEGHWTADAEL